MKLRFYLAALSMIAVTLVVPAALVSAEDPCSVAGYNDESICGHQNENEQAILQDKTKNTLNVVYFWTGIITVIVIIIGGIMLSTSLGDPGKIKIAKNAIIFAVIGLVITMLAFAITNFILGAVGGTNSSTSGGSSSSSSSPSNAGESGGDSGNGDSSTKTVEVEGVDVKAISDITVGFTRKAEASVIPDYATDRTITWSSSNPAVATVSGDGTVKGISEGTATITATANNGKSNSVKVKITKPILIKTIKLNRSDFELEKDRYAAIVATSDPTYATNKTIVWSSSDASIVSVDQNGRVHAIKNGDAIITATAKDGGGAKASVKVSVGLVEQLITEAKNVTNYIYVNGYTYGDAAHNPAMDHPADKVISCDRCVDWYLYNIGYKDQPYEHGLVVVTLAPYLKSHGFKKITDQNALQKGDIVFTKPINLAKEEADHVFIIGDYRGNGNWERYDCGSAARIQHTGQYAGGQPYVEPITEFAFAYRLP